MGGERLSSAQELRELATGILTATGAPIRAASEVAGSLVESNVAGHDSHGVRRLPSYVRAVRDGTIDPCAVPEVDSRRSATAVIAGRRAFGQLAARCATAELESLCFEYGTATVSIRECNHIGRLGEYVGDLAERGLIAFALSNADATVAPFAGRERRLGTNPLAWALPRAEGRPPLVMDWATAAVAEGKLAVSRARGEKVAPDLLIDDRGRVSTDPEDFYRNGALLPFGGHKGYGLSVIIEIMGGLLTGTGISSLPGYDGRFGTVLTAMDVSAFLPLQHFRAQAEQFCLELARTSPAEGYDEVLVPGEIEERNRRHRMAEGIPLPHATWRELQELRYALEEEQAAANSVVPESRG